ncbi:unnamed protein product [Darwinula stevensoni]|uniref:C-type lectin domain-containing protein n=1 Tax=Darwinula stevensoni TaxID=69355 RepID=A0A7R8XHX8_9CRUS|nr:unnamed protein product [Darwinula stevensoni]CAG0893878.1 unnamed protein product [Darwinula stevensoni]
MARVTWLFVSLFWTVTTAIHTAKFFAPDNKTKQILNPFVQLNARSALHCSMACLDRMNCFTYSVTKGSGSVDCRLSSTYDPQRILNSDSSFYYREVTAAGYNPVPGTLSYVRTVVDRTKDWPHAEADCETVGGRLAVDNNQQIHDYISQAIVALGIYAHPAQYYGYFWIGGYSSTDYLHWRLLDGTTVNITGPGTGPFHASEPEAGTNCLEIAVYPVPDPTCCSAKWGGDMCNWISWTSGYFCEIKIPN